MFVMLIHAMIHAMAACNPVPSDAVCPHGWEPQAGAGGALQFGVGLGLGCHDWAVACLHFCFARCLTLCALRTQVLAQIAEGAGACWPRRLQRDARWPDEDRKTAAQQLLVSVG